jgi:hypothetical protein
MLRYSFGLKIAASTTVALLGLVMAGCGDETSNTTTTSSSSSSSGEAGNGGMGGAGVGGAGGTGGTGGAADPCTLQNSLCFDLLVPVTATEAPKQLAVTFYSSLPAMGPPDGGIGLLQMNPVVQPGAAYKVQVNDLTVSGDYLVYVALFMPGGGMFQPVAGVDYDVATPMKVTFNGAPVSLPALQLKLHAAGDGHGP